MDLLMHKRRHLPPALHVSGKQFLGPLFFTYGSGPGMLAGSPMHNIR